MRQNLLLFLFMALFSVASNAQYTVSGNVFEDLNANGTRDLGEPGLAGVAVTLIDDGTGMAILAPVNTGAGGNFLFFNNVPMGTYYARFSYAALNPAFIVTLQDVGGFNTQANDILEDSDPGVTAPHDSHLFTVDATTTIEDKLSMGLFLPANIDGEVWEDLDGNGIDGGEPNTPINVNVTLLDQATLTPVALDANGNPLTNPVSTNSTYSFDDITPGDYIIEFSEPGGPYPGGLHLTKQDQAGVPNSQAGDVNNDSDADNGTGLTFDITLNSNQTVSGIDAGYFVPGQVGDFVWEDLNGNGLQDGGEPGLAGIQVRLLFSTGAAALDPDGNNIPPQNTDGAGMYLFDEVPPGTYKVAFQINPGGNFYFTKKDAGADDIDSDADRVTGETANFTIMSGDPENIDLDAGYYEKCTIGDFTWHDLNGNGIQDGGEPDISVNISIIDVATGSAPLFQVNGTTAYNANLVSGANYIFDNLPPGEYKLTFTKPANYFFTEQFAGGATTDSDPDRVTGMTVNITCNSGEEIEDIDAGYFTKCIISDFTWEDLNGDGEQSEPGLNGVQVEIIDTKTGNPPLVKADGTPYVLNNINSAGGGMYIFNDLPPGIYKLTFTAPGGYFLTTQDATADHKDSDADVMTGMTMDIVCNSAEIIDHVDAGFFEAGSIQGLAWHDSNGDGIFSGGEPLLDGATFTLIYTGGPTLDVFGNPVPPTVTAGGFYNFTDIRPGTYTMTVGLPMWIPTLENVTGDPGDMPDAPDDSDFDAGGNLVNDVLIPSGESIDGRNAGFYKLITVGGSIWGEDDNNAMLDPGETGGFNVVVELYDANGVLVATTLGDANGNYQFDDVVPGDYKVVIAASNFVSGGPLYGLLSCDGQGADDDTDNDDNGAPGALGVESVQIALYCGEEPGTDGVENFTIDFCFEANCGLENPLAAPLCEDADTICDLNLLAIFCSRMPTQISVGNVPSPLCEGQGAPHNMSWFAFVAGGGNYTMVIEPFACAGGQNGAQLGIYEDCTFTNSIYCQSIPCVTGPQFIPSTLFTPGQVYFFWMDGCSASVCSYDIEIQGDFQQYQIPEIVDIECSSSFGRCDTICPNNSITFDARNDYDNLTAKFTWRVIDPNGVETFIETDDRFLDYTFTELGDYTIELVDIFVKCSLPIQPYAITVTVANPANEDFGTWPVCENLLDLSWIGPNVVYNTNISDPNGDGLAGWLAGDINAPGVINRPVVAANGCEFNQKVTVIKTLNSVPVNLDTFLCPGESLTVGNFTYSTEVWPQDMVFLTNEAGCDSLVNVILIYLGLDGEVVDVGCVSGGYQIQFNQGPNPFVPFIYNAFSFEYEYEWRDQNGNLINDGDPDGDPRTLLVSASGTYTLTVIQSFENGLCQIEMDPLTVDLSGLAPDQVTPGTPWGTLLCEDNATFTYTMDTPVDPSEILSYIWTYPANATIIGQSDTSSITIDWTGTTGGEVCVSIQTICGISPPLCDTIDIVPIPVAAIPALPVICVDSLLAVTATGTPSAGYIYTWNFNGGTLVTNPAVGPGPHQVSWGDPGIKDVGLVIGVQSCMSNMATSQVEVVAPVPAPLVDCSGSQGQIQFTWPSPPGATGYSINVINGPTGVLNGNTYTVTVPGNQIVQVDLILTTTTNSPCGSLISASGCESQDCVPPTVDIEPVADICLTNNSAPITLSTIINPAGPGTTLFAGPGITDPVNGVFDPKLANIGANTITFDFEDPAGCKDKATQIINVYETPTADFIANQLVICQDSTVEVEYNGSITTGGTYTWNFGNDVVTPGNGIGPFDLKWTNPGQKKITLTTSKNGCVSDPFDLEVLVEPRIANVDIECIDQKATEITVGWNGITNISDYTLFINGAAQPNTTGLTYNLTGLLPNDVVFFELVANSNNACPGTRDTVTCIAELCPPIIIDLSVGDTTICLDANATPFTIDAVVTGGLGTGTGVVTWSGKGIDANGYFDPVVAGPSTGAGHRITLKFVEGNCDEETSINIRVLAQPKATFSIPDTICILDDLNISYSGTPGQPLSWKTPNGVSITQQSATKYSTKFAAEGNYTIGLVVGNAACLSVLEEHTVRVDPELDLVDISCVSTLSSVEFSWADIDCASDYQVIVDGVNQGTQSGLTYLLSNLAEGTKVTIEVTPVSDCACPGTKIVKECEARACPPIVLALSSPQDKFCVGDVTSSFPLVANVTGSGGTGSGVWSGTGVNAQGTFNPQGLAAGVYTLKYKFSEESCDFEEEVDITIYGNPAVNVTTNSPDCYMDNFGSVNQVTTGGNGVYTYRLDGNAIQLSDLDRIVPGNHILVVNDGNNCDGSSSFIIGSANEPSIEATGQPEILKGQTTSLSVTNGQIVGQLDSIVWTNSAGEILCSGLNCRTINIKPETDDTYCARLYYNGGCFIEDCFSQIVRPLIEIILPNIITIGEGGNSNFFIQNYANIDMVKSLTIFDRWGNLVYSRSNYKPQAGDTGWDGTINGKDVVPGVYAYTIDLVLTSGKDLKINGDVTVIK
ncbi:MAG: gliding motility-associated C-terminal domain-containing protein [Saprospiraceae bacterium]|nr:gliding motility-associated C-terminal domain-containing protein [Saprospiraceae bacterium]